jgi:hypothetical protein
LFNAPEILPHLITTSAIFYYKRSPSARIAWTRRTLTKDHIVCGILNEKENSGEEIDSVINFCWGLKNEWFSQNIF